MEDERLVNAAFDCNLASVKELLDDGVDVNSRDSHNSTALEHAADFGQAGMVKLLLEHGAGVNTSKTMVPRCCTVRVIADKSRLKRCCGMQERLSEHTN